MNGGTFRSEHALTQASIENRSHAWWVALAVDDHSEQVTQIGEPVGRLPVR
jgi:hypothetical protein